MGIQVLINFSAVLGLRRCADFFQLQRAECAGFSWPWLLLLQPRGSRARGLPQSRHVGSVVVAPGLSCFTARGIFPDQGSNLCLWHWQVGSSPLSLQGSPGGSSVQSSVLPASGPRLLVPLCSETQPPTSIPPWVSHLMVNCHPSEGLLKPSHWAHPQDAGCWRAR